jgi:IclR family transcriptional regulator, pca regulon regulatory protein
LRQRRGRQFLLRPSVLEIGAAYLDSMEIRAVTRTKLEELALASRGSAALSVLSGDGVVFVARASARTEPLRLEAQVGTRMPAHATAMGKVLLAGLGPEQRRAFFQRHTLQRVTEFTVLDPQLLLQQIEAVGARGHATVESEMTPGVNAIAVPVHDGAGRVVAALNITVHDIEATGAELVAKYLAGLRAAAAAISAEVARVPGLALGAQV